jgi:hypothetical protein
VLFFCLPLIRYSILLPFHHLVVLLHLLAALSHHVPSVFLCMTHYRQIFSFGLNADTQRNLNSAPQLVPLLPND